LWLVVLLTEVSRRILSLRALFNFLVTASDSPILAAAEVEVDSGSVAIRGNMLVGGAALS